MIESRFTKLTTRIAVTLVMLFSPVQAVMAQTTPEPPNVTVHIVQDDETLETIAALYGTSIQSIQLANTIADPQDIFVGQRLIIPALKDNAQPISTARATAIVGFGDTLTTLAAQFDLTPEQLGQSNRIVNPARMYAGEVITLPLDEQPGSQAGSSPVRLEAADSIWKMAFRVNANVVALTLLNQVHNPFILSPGSIIVIPEAGDSTQPLPSPWTSIVLHPLPLEQGRSGGLRISSTIPGKMKADFLSRDVQFVSSELSHEAVLGIDRWTESGLYPLTITLEDDRGTVWTYTQDVLITDGEYASEVIRASEETSSVLSDAQAVEQEADFIKQTATRFTSERHWDGLFFLPVAGVLTSPFGSVRTYAANETVTFHTGADLAIKTGTPIYAPADGVVVETGELDVRGFVTLIEHGAGVYTGYWHQASILVKPGEKVTAGQQIGTVGSTGFSTASHLHWEMWVGGVQVDPMQWVREVFP